MLKDYYFFFDKNDMPLAVFLANHPERAINLFSRLYRQTWFESVESGVTMLKEQDVPVERWDEIHSEYKRRERKKSKSKTINIPVVTPIKPLVYEEYNNEYNKMALETAKYLRK